MTKLVMLISLISMNVMAENSTPFCDAELHREAITKFLSTKFRKKNTGFNSKISPINNNLLGRISIFVSKFSDQDVLAARLLIDTNGCKKGHSNNQFLPINECRKIMTEISGVIKNKAQQTGSSIKDIVMEKIDGRFFGGVNTIGLACPGKFVQPSKIPVSQLWKMAQQSARKAPTTENNAYYINNGRRPGWDKKRNCKTLGPNLVTVCNVNLSRKQQNKKNQNSSQ